MVPSFLAEVGVRSLPGLGAWSTETVDGHLHNGRGRAIAEREMASPSIPRSFERVAAQVQLVAASTMAMSCSVDPPLTPTPAMTLPSLVSGTPPPIAEYRPPETARRG